VVSYQILIQAIKQAESEGLIDSARLFPKGGNHESISRDVEAFDRLIYAEWEAGIKVKDEKEKRREFREFLSYRQKIWDEEYARWLKSR
jgi:Cu2+-containing amine oxidase